jgi:hypothetical protein
MKMTCIVAALFAGAFVASGADPVPEPDDHSDGLVDIVPRKFRAGRAEYAFDETYLLERFRYELDQCEANKDEGENREQTRIEIAYCVISAGIFAQKSAELQGLFDRTQRILGDQKVPHGVLSPITAVVACASLSFKNQEGEPLDVDTGHLAPEDFHQLLLIAKLQLDARTAKKGGSGEK